MLYLKNVSTLELDAEKCIGCGICVDVCPHNVLRISLKKAAVSELDRCMECGACRMNCPADAIQVKKGVGCAAAVIFGFFHKSDPECGCSCGDGNGGCC